jgi:hypothetical protein
MPQFPWNPRTPVEPDREYAVMASKLPLKSHSSIPGFLRGTLTIRRQLRSAPGLVGYSLLGELAGKTFWTFSVWEKRADLDNFARTNPHSRIIQRLRPKMGHGVFEFETVEGSRLPWGWEEVKRHVREPANKEGQ